MDDNYSDIEQEYNSNIQEDEFYSRKKGMRS